MVMADFTLLCFGESGNAFKVAFMLQACELSWKPQWVDFFNGETRSQEYRQNFNEMGEAPVLLHGSRKFTQSGVILDYLAEVSRRYGPKSDDERREILRWMLFDNHKLSSPVASLRYMISIAKTGETPVTEWLRGRALGALKVLDGHLMQQPYVIGKRPTIADFSLFVLRRRTALRPRPIRPRAKLARPPARHQRLETPLRSDAEDGLRRWCLSINSPQPAVIPTKVGIQTFNQRYRRQSGFPPARE
jgi:glutathione S-transferase